MMLMLLFVVVPAHSFLLSAAYTLTGSSSLPSNLHSLVMLDGRSALGSSTAPPPFSAALVCLRLLLLEMQKTEKDDCNSDDSLNKTCLQKVPSCVVPQWWKQRESLCVLVSHDVWVVSQTCIEKLVFSDFSVSLCRNLDASTARAGRFASDLTSNVCVCLWDSWSFHL